MADKRLYNYKYIRMEKRVENVICFVISLQADAVKIPTTELDYIS